MLGRWVSPGAHVTAVGVTTQRASTVVWDRATGEPVGLAMSALMPVSLEPCSMAIAINRAGSAHDAMIRAGRFPALKPET